MVQILSKQVLRAKARVESDREVLVVTAKEDRLCSE